jgi:hypothetical protein
LDTNKSFEEQKPMREEANKKIVFETPDRVPKTRGGMF